MKDSNEGGVARHVVVTGPGDRARRAREDLNHDLGVIQERLVADAFAAGHDATQWPMYAVIVALRQYAKKDQS